MKKQKQINYVIETPSDLTNDVFLMLESVGVTEIKDDVLVNTIHSVFNAQKLIEHAANLFCARKRTGLITFEQLINSMKKLA